MLVLQPQRQQHFLDLALERALGLQEQVLGKLLGQRRAALGEAAARHIVEDGARKADRIDADMRIEAAVLDGDDGHRYVGRHLVQADRLAAGHAAIGDQLAVDRDDLDVGRPVGNRPVGDARHARAIEGDDAGGGDAAPDGQDEAPVEKAPRAAEQAATRSAPRLRRAAALGGFLLAAGGFAIGRHDAIFLTDGKARWLARPGRTVESRLDACQLPAMHHSVP